MGIRVYSVMNSQGLCSLMIRMGLGVITWYVVMLRSPWNRSDNCSCFHIVSIYWQGYNDEITEAHLLDCEDMGKRHSHKQQ